MAATVVLRGWLRQATYRTLIGLLSVTGMRVGEAIRLDRDDVDLAKLANAVERARARALAADTAHTHPSSLPAQEAATLVTA
jgi:integrase